MSAKTKHSLEQEPYLWILSEKGNKSVNCSQGRSNKFSSTKARHSLTALGIALFRFRELSVREI